MRHQDADASHEGTPVSVEAALRRVRILSAVLIFVRLVTVSRFPVVLSVVLVAGFSAVNAISYVGERHDDRVRARLGVVQLAADVVVVLLVVWAHRGDTASADWAVLVLPVIEAAIRFQLVGAVATWAVLAVTYGAWNVWGTNAVTLSTLAQRLTVVLLVALPSGFLAEELVAEIAAHRRGRRQAEQRSALLRDAALGGQRSTRLDVDEILDVLRFTIADMGFAEPQVFELSGTEPHALTARPVRQSRDVLAIPPGDPRIMAAAAARAAGKPAMWPPDTPTRRPAAPDRFSSLFALPVTEVDDAFVVVTARWPDAAPPAAEIESLELFAAQAGASLRNAQVHRELQALKDRLAHEAAHDALTDLPNRRRFTDELERVCGRGRAGDLVAVLFLDLDGFKDVNDRYGHDSGNELLVAVANRLRNCVRPGDLVARMGGDEFTVLLTRLQGIPTAVEVADRICSVISEPFPLSSGAAHISTSIGIAVAASHDVDPSDLLRRADVAMYRTKSQGKAGWSIDPASLEPAGASPPDA